jgi:hypothetical protein
LCLWDAAAPAVRIARPSAGGIELRDSVFEQGSTCNPRDEWPVPGKIVRGGTFYAKSCQFSGTTGVSPAPDVDLRHGTIATFVDCNFSSGNGIRICQASTMIAINCKNIDTPTLDNGSYLIVLESM